MVLKMLFIQITWLLHVMNIFELHYSQYRLKETWMGENCYDTLLATTEWIQNAGLNNFSLSY